MRKTCIYLITCVLLLGSAYKAEAQGGGFIFTGGVAAVAMKDMKYLQEYILSTYPVEGRVTSSFPPYTSISLTLYKQVYDYFRVGISYSYSTTGGKSSYQDYSGEIYTEITATSHRLGAYLSYVILGGDRLDLALSGRLDANYTPVLIESYYNIFNYGSNLSNSYRSISPGGSIGTELWYRLRKISLGLEAGYMVDLKGDLKASGDGDPLTDPNDRDRVLTSDWSGWLVRASLLINLNQ
jgi:hypothetical protein